MPGPWVDTATKYKTPTIRKSAFDTTSPYTLYQKADLENTFNNGSTDFSNYAKDGVAMEAFKPTDLGIVTPHTNLYYNAGGSNGSTTPTADTGWFGRDGYLATGAAVAGGLSGLAGAYTGYKNYQLAQDQFESEKAYAGANLYNQGTLINNQIKNAAEVGQSLAGDTMTADQRAAGLAAAASKYVKTGIN